MYILKGFQSAADTWLAAASSLEWNLSTRDVDNTDGWQHPVNRKRKCLSLLH